MTDYSKVKYSYDKNPKIFPSIRRINRIDDEIREIRKKRKEELDKLEKEKEAIQDECDHHYHLRATGAYDDLYECKFCGHEIDK